MINRYEVVVESCDRRDGHPWLRLGRARLAARPWPGIRAGAKASVRIRPEEVLLCEGHPGRVSARNVLPGHVRSVKVVPEGAYVTLDVGFPLTALITRSAAKELRVRKGVPLFAVVKASAVAPEAEVSPAFRVSAVGPRGTIPPERIDLLRALDRVGSLSAAAREEGVSFRTAWTWTREMNRAWGAPLVERVRGGRGGGGATLTPAARALLARIDRIEMS